jgi:hypothetical protein
MRLAAQGEPTLWTQRRLYRRTHPGMHCSIRECTVEGECRLRRKGRTAQRAPTSRRQSILAAEILFNRR